VFGTNLLPTTSLVIKPVDCSVKELTTCQNECHKVEQRNFNSTASQAPNLTLELTLGVKEEYSSSHALNNRYHAKFKGI
jgi:hypothetical protein